MDVDVGHSRHHGPAAFIDDRRARRRCESALDAADPSVFDYYGRRPALWLRGVDDEPPGLDSIGGGIGCTARDQHGGAGQQMSKHGKSLSPGEAIHTATCRCFKLPLP